MMTAVRRASNVALLIVIAALAGACAPAVGGQSRSPTARPSSVAEAPAPSSPLATVSPTTPPTARPTARPTAAPPIGIEAGEPWIVYSWFRPGESEKSLFLARPDGSDAHAILTGLPGGQASPVWSPDGSRIAFGSNRSVWTANADGTAPELLTDGAGQCPDGVYHPDWSPDGSKLAVICYPDTNPGGGSVATVDLATKTLTRLTTVKWPEHLDGAPSWSPDGRSIAFAILHWDPTDQFLDGSQIAVVAADGGEVRRITPLDTFMSYPDWSPDGSEILMHDYDLGNMHAAGHSSNLYTIKPDGTGQRQITTSSVDGNWRIAQPRWSSDGTSIIVSIAISTRKDGEVNDVQLALIDQVGGEPVLMSPAIHGGQPDWRPSP